MQELNEKIIKWAKDRGIDKKGTVEAQSIKTIEEMSGAIKQLETLVWYIESNQYEV